MDQKFTADELAKVEAKYRLTAATVASPAELATSFGRPLSAEEFRHMKVGLRESKAIVALLDARDQVISSLNAKAVGAPTDAESTRTEDVEA